MAYFNLKNVRIKAVAATVPDDVEYTTDYSELFGEEHIKKFIMSTGVKRRFTVHRLGVTASDLCCAAAEKILEELNYDRSKIDALVFASSSRDYTQPVTATILQERLGLMDDCMCYDVPLGCSAYVYGLYLSAMHINSGCRSVLLLAGSTGEQMPEGYTPSEIPMLFGNGGSATLLEYDESSKPVYGLLRSIGRDFKMLTSPFSGQRHAFWPMVEQYGFEKACVLRNLFHMEGMDVMRFSLKEVVTMINDFKDHFNCNYEDYDILACHQANKLIISNLARKIKFPISKIPLSIVDYGNTGCASIPLAICDYYSNKDNINNTGDILTCGFGIGLSLGIVGVNVSPENCFGVFKVKERFDDGLRVEDYL